MSNSTAIRAEGEPIVFTLTSDQFRQYPSHNPIREIAGLPRVILDKIREGWKRCEMIQDILLGISEILKPYLDKVTINFDDATTRPLSEFMEELKARAEA